jgi:mono/diheme cytochrome c family protein
MRNWFPPVPADRAARAFFAIGLLAVAGCSQAPPRFALNTEGRDPHSIGPARAELIRDMLEELFGAPDEPRVPPGVPLRLDLLQIAAGPVGGDAQGKQHGLFRRYCVTCHGLSGGGDGPAAYALEPYPRDFRAGKFKYTSTVGGAKPVRKDLETTLLRGIPGTAMPSWSLLPLEEIDALVEYVKYLSIRGETELYLLSLVIDEDETGPLHADLVLDEGLLPAVRSWQRAGSQRVQPPPQPPADTPQQWAASIERGRLLYLSKDAQCVKCHGTLGRGDGEETELYDDWNKPKKGLTEEKTAELASRFNLPIQKLHPRNFARGIFHGGSRPVDLYDRIDAGIKGTPMPAAGPSPGNRGALKPEQIWDVVNYVLSLAGRQ